MSLNNALFADLESDDDTEYTRENSTVNDVTENKVPIKIVKIRSLRETAQDSLSGSDSKQITDVTSVSGLMNRLNLILNLIDKTALGDSTEYSLLVEANSYSVEIDDAILTVHQFIKKRYQKRFSELDSLVQTPVEYARAVLAIGNNVKTDSVTSSESADVNLSKLKLVVSPATFMIISMASYESKGESLSNAELKEVSSACELLLSLKSAKDQITQFVSSRLAHFAPNVTEVIGSHATAQLLGASGGLKKLGATPSSNIPSLGSKGIVGVEISQTPTRDRGFLYYSPIVQNVPPEFRTQAMRIISGKLVLAARVDFSNSISKKRLGKDADEYGKKLHREIMEKLERLLEPPENKSHKALPVPLDKPSKKRAGRRIRKFKEQHKMTELQRVQNRVTFGLEETYDNDLADLGGSLGTTSAKSLSIGNSGQIRILNLEKSQGKISKGMANRLQRLNGKSLGISKKISNDNFSSGMVSSITFSQSQGIELVDPSKKSKNSSTMSNGKECNNWFQSGAFSLHNKDFFDFDAKNNQN